MFLSRNVINMNVKFPSSLTFLVPGQVPGAGHTHCSIGQCIRPAGILIKCSVAHKTWKTTINVKISTALLAELDRQDQYVTWPLIRGLSSVFQHTSLNITVHFHHGCQQGLWKTPAKLTIVTATPAIACGRMRGNSPVIGGSLLIFRKHSSRYIIHLAIKVLRDAADDICKSQLVRLHEKFTWIKYSCKTQNKLARRMLRLVFPK